MKRNPRKVRWTKAFRRSHGKEMTTDTTLEFEQKRNKPEKYNRLRMHTTLKAMKRVAEIRQAREKQFYLNRMKEAGKKKQEYLEAVRDLKENINLIAAPAALTEKPVVLMETEEIPKKKNKKKPVTEMQD